MAKAPKKPTEPAACSGCLFFDVQNGNICRGNGPIPSSLHGAPALWPVVGPDDWCKEYLALGSAWP